jgi:hypothetical protein
VDTTPGYESRFGKPRRLSAMTGTIIIIDILQDTNREDES